MRKRIISQHKRGFTMVELSLSIAFIAVLSIAVVLIITNAISSYHRGLTLNKINTVGMDLVDDFRSAIQNAPAKSTKSECISVFVGEDNQNELKNCQNDSGRNFVSLSHYGLVQIGKSTEKTEVPLYGAFCTGEYSYIWNSGYFFNDSSNDTPAKLNYNGTVIGDGDTPFKLLKIQDKNREVCISALGEQYTFDNDDDIPINKGEFIYGESTIDEEPADILGGETENNLAIYDLSTAIPAESSSRKSMFYSVSFILGTVQGGINIKATGDFCATPGGYNSSVENFDYCAINKFNFAAQASGGQNVK